jgi:intracellular septation protein A
MIVLKALVPIVRVLLGTFLFVALFLFTHNIELATACGISLVIAQTILMKLRHRPIGALHWLSLILISMFGGATILFHSQYFIMVKPTILWLALGAVLLRRDWMAPYLPPIVTDNLDDADIVRAGLAYAGLMFVLAVLNSVIVGLVWLDVATAEFWAVYALAGPTAAQAVLLAVFYFCFRKKVLARIRARQALTAALDA